MSSEYRTLAIATETSPCTHSVFHCLTGDIAMSDKFFFKGRQDPRLDHRISGYSTKAGLKSGSRKYPLQLTVASEQRKAELAVLIAENDLFADIQVSADCDTEKNVDELMALINKAVTTTVASTPNRNDPCSCGSGKKYKKCCG
jgi:SWIM/SEC-C metal-binding protein